jgi:predicted transcriptional regulator of viral defense system
MSGKTTEAVDHGLPVTFTSAETASYGVSRRGLQRMLATGLVERVSRGLYRRTDSAPLDYDFIEIAVKAHKPTLCLISALARHELTDIIPAVHDVALPRGSWRPRTSAPVRWHTFDAATFEIGRDEIQVDDTHLLGCYDAPRSIVDAFRLCHEFGPDLAHEALRRWLRRGGEPAALIRTTNSFRAAKPAVLYALQVLLG